MELAISAPDFFLLFLYDSFSKRELKREKVLGEKFYTETSRGSFQKKKKSWFLVSTQGQLTKNKNKKPGGVKIEI